MAVHEWGLPPFVLAYVKATTRTNRYSDMQRQVAVQKIAMRRAKSHSNLRGGVTLGTGYKRWYAKFWTSAVWQGDDEA